MLLGLCLAVALGAMSPLRVAGNDAAMLKRIASRVDGRMGVIAIEATTPVPYIASQPDPKTFVVELRDVGEALVRAEGVQMIAMTGSTAAGKRILEVAAATLKKVHLELGGNDATIVCGDADIETTADALIAGRFTSGNGQICCAVKRVLVEKPIYQKLLDSVAARATKLRVGDPMDPATDVGPLINRRGAERVEERSGDQQYGNRRCRKPEHAPRRRGLLQQACDQPPAPRGTGNAE
jgi:hypothetical protein